MVKYFFRVPKPVLPLVYSNKLLPVLNSVWVLNRTFIWLLMVQVGVYLISRGVVFLLKRYYFEFIQTPNTLDFTKVGASYRVIFNLFSCGNTELF